MGGMGSLMAQLFGGVTPPAQQAPVQGANNPTQVTNPGQPLPGSDPANPAAPAGSVDANSTPLDAFKDIWNTPDNTNTEATDFFAKLDPAKVMESARKVNFAGGVTPELMAKIAAGGPEAIQAFQQAINNSSQQVYGRSTVTTAEIVKAALAEQREQFQKQLPGIMKGMNLTDSLQTENPLYANPALAPLVEMAKTQFLQKNPTATQSEIKQQVNDFMNAMQSALAPKPIKTAEQKAAETDWTSFLE
jgi:hypothetical protein